MVPPLIPQGTSGPKSFVIGFYRSSLFTCVSSLVQIGPNVPKKLNYTASPNICKGTLSHINWSRPQWSSCSIPPTNSTQIGRGNPKVFISMCDDRQWRRRKKKRSKHIMSFVLSNEDKNIISQVNEFFEEWVYQNCWNAMCARKLVPFVAAKLQRII